MGGWLSLNQACSHLGLSRSTMYRMCEDGRLVAHELPGVRGLRFALEDLNTLPTKLRRGRNRVVTRRRGSL
jgi:excisionase family DNA binding protein